MTIDAYLPTGGASFSPESATNMGKALDGALDILGIEPSDTTKREAVARFIIKLAEIDGGVDGGGPVANVNSSGKNGPPRFTVKGRTILIPAGPKDEIKRPIICALREAFRNRSSAGGELKRASQKSPLRRY